MNCNRNYHTPITTHAFQRMTHWSLVRCRTELERFPASWLENGLPCVKYGHIVRVYGKELGLDRYDGTRWQKDAITIPASEVYRRCERPSAPLQTDAAPPKLTPNRPDHVTLDYLRAHHGLGMQRTPQKGDGHAGDHQVA